MSAVASRVTSRLSDLLRNGLGAPIIVLAMLAMVVLPLSSGLPCTRSSA